MMGTKVSPGRYDCYGKAQNNEPLFTVLARDPQGADLVHLWAALRGKDMIGVDRLVERMKERALQVPRRAGDADKVAEAVNCSEAMRNWERGENKDCRTVEPGAVAPAKLGS